MILNEGTERTEQCFMALTHNAVILQEGRAAHKIRADMNVWQLF